MRGLFAFAFACLLSVGVVSVGSVEVADAQVGIASYYKSGKRTANGESFNPNGFTAAHRTLKFGTRVKVTNLRNGQSVIVRINDRGPFIAGRIIDLAYGAARAVGLHLSGTAKVQMTVLK
ncbi:MAG: septal ring lytic transglycosylase RlpA family protein [Rhizobiales bacterium]|nr:septal ring lytic transglycosylase RlpA family protein [Hyphomicrobiales bacterium]